MWAACASRFYGQLLRRTKWPILVGPFRGEVGFEVLYWLPFLAKLRDRYGLDPQRFIPVTRGGAKVWYGGADGIDLFDLRDPAAVRVENLYQFQQRQMFKQKWVTAWDRAVLQDVAMKLGLRRYHVLHPWLMFRTLSPWFERETRGLRYLNQCLKVDPLPVPPVPEGLELPQQFVAVRFYVRYTYPPAETTKVYAEGVIRQLASHLPVVLLNSGVHADDHFDYSFQNVPNVIRIESFCRPSNNLAVQSAVLARAMAFVGTHGGLAQLALRHGVPSVSFYSRWGGTAVQHKHLADQLALITKVPYHVVRLRETDLLRAVLPPISMAASS